MSSSLARDQCRGLKNDYENAAKLGAIGLIGAGVFITAGVVLWLTDSAPGPVRTALTHCGLASGQKRVAADCVFMF